MVRTLEIANARLILTAFGTFEPVNVIVQTPKRHILAWFTVFWAILHQNPLTRHFSRRVRRKYKNNKKDKALYFTYLPRRALYTDLYRFWVTC